MLSKKIRSAIAVVMAGTIVAAMPAVSAVTPCLENRLSITASASGGTTPYTYAFYYKNINGSSWTKKQDFSSNSSVSIKFSTPDTYNICAKVKDQSGTIVKKYFTVTVTK